MPNQPEAGSPRIVDRAEHNAATSFRDHGGGPPEQHESVTGRPNDLKKDEVSNSTLASRKAGDSGMPTSTRGDARNSTLADRAKARQESEKRVSAKQVRQNDDEDVENKQVSRSTTKRRTARK